MAGRRHLCKDTKGIGVNRPGAFAEYLSLPMTNVWVHEHVAVSKAAGSSGDAKPSRSGSEQSVSLRDVQSIFDPLGNAVHTALSFDLLGEDVLITGAGPIGCMAAAICQYAGARYVVVTDVNPWR